MEKEQLYQTIEAYLDGELTGRELAAFERELATDKSLAREVALHRNLQRRLGNASKVALRAKLDNIAREFPESDLDPGEGPDGPTGTGSPSGGGIPFWVYGLSFFLVIGGGVTWYLLTKDPETVSSLTPEPAEAVTEVNEDPAVDEDTQTLTPEENNDTEPAPAAEPADSRSTSANRPQAFSTNRELELLIGDEPPSKRYEFSDASLTHSVQGSRSYITYSGKLVTGRSVEEGFFLNLYNNQYPDGRVFREPMTFSEVKENNEVAFAAKKEYMTAYSGETDLEPALYYGVVTHADSSIPLWVGKIRVE